MLLVQRNPEQRFMGGAWVFPGGATSDGDSESATAIRELAEEAGSGWATGRSWRATPGGSPRPR